MWPAIANCHYAHKSVGKRRTAHKVPQVWDQTEHSFQIRNIPPFLVALCIATPPQGALAYPQEIAVSRGVPSVIVDINQSRAEYCKLLI
jgi:hypothetical protein